MKFIRVKTHELEPLAEEMFAAKGNNVAITPWRAHSQATNPYAEDDDVLMIYARDDNGYLAGFTGLLPGLLNGREGERIFWVSCWYADPAYRGGKVAVPFLEDSLDITGKRIIHTDISVKTARYLERLGDFSIRKREGVLLRMRSSLHYRAGYLKPVSFQNRLIRTIARTGVLKLTDLLINLIKRPDLTAFSGKLPESTGIVTSGFPSENQMAYIWEKSANEFIRPGRKLIQWWMAGGWVTGKKALYASLEKRYYFSSFAKDFHFTWLDITDQGERLGIALLNFRDGTIKTPYLWYEKEKEETFFYHLYRYILSGKRNNVVLTFHEAFAAYMQRFPETFQSVEHKTRYSAITGELARAGGEALNMQDGDGDNLFT